MVILPALRRITVFVGGLGVGKTELAINAALGLADGNCRVSLVDLDVINPYYRTRYVKQQLESRTGLEVICPDGDLLQADVPALSPAIYGVFSDIRRWGVFDVGGDDVGAVVLGRFRPYVTTDTAVFFVVNAFRHRTGTAARIIRMVREIEKAARLPVDYLVNNSNLGSETVPHMVADGHEITAAAARELGCPVAFAGVRQDLVPAVRHLMPEVPLLPLRRFMVPPWDDRTE